MSGTIRDPNTGELSFIGRYRKPGFIQTASNQVTLKADSSTPAFFVIGGFAYEVKETLECSMLAIGVGGLSEGTLFTASTPYYLYGVISNSQVGLIADISAPSAGGPKTFTTWTYLGAFCTDSGSASITPFISTNGFYLADNELNTASHTGTGTPQIKPFSNIPVTAKMAYGILIADGPNTNTNHRAMGSNISGNNAILQTVSVANIEVEALGYVPLFTAQTIYLQTDNAGNTVSFTLLGWVESPEEYL